MGICVSCGQKYDDEAGFCSYCGTEHSADGAAAAPGRPQAPLSDQASAASLTATRTTPTTPSAGALPATAAPGPPVARGRRTSALAVVLIVAVVAVAAIVAVVLLRAHGGTGGSSGSVLSPSPRPSAPAVVKITSLRDGTKVIGGQALRVTVSATGVAGIEGLQLFVNGQATGDMKPIRGQGGSPSTSLPWRPPARGAKAILRVEAKFPDGRMVASKTISVTVRSATVPVVTVTKWAEPQPSPYPWDGGSGDGEPSTPFWAAFFTSAKTYAGADAKAADVRSAGFDNVHVLYTLDYNNLGNGEAWYSAYLGPYDTEADAAVGVAELEAAGFHAYSKEVQ